MKVEKELVAKLRQDKKEWDEIEEIED